MPDQRPTLGKICISYGSPMGLQSGMSVSDGAPIRHVGLQWVSDRSLIGLRKVSDNNNIFVNSHCICIVILGLNKNAMS